MQDNKAPGAITTGQRPGVDASKCRKCGAKRIDAQIGLEKTPEEYEGEPDLDHQKECGGDANGEYFGESTKDYQAGGAQDASATKARILAGMKKRRTIDWGPTCTCGREDVVPCVVLDPFMGSGTTAQVALEAGRAAIGCELNPEYVPLIEKRTTTTMGFGF